MENSRLYRNIWKTPVSGLDEFAILMHDIIAKSCFFSFFSVLDGKTGANCACVSSDMPALVDVPVSGAD